MCVRVAKMLITVVVVLGLNGCAFIEDALYAGMRGLARDFASLELKEARVADTMIAYMERSGTGAVIVLVHGFAASKNNWIKLIPKIPKSYRVIALDLPGHGDSEFKTSETYSAPVLAEAVISLLEALDIDEYHLVGNSLGGLVITEMAGKYSERIRSLALLNSVGVYPPNESELQQLLEVGDNPLLVNTTEGFDRLIDFVIYEKPFMLWPIRPSLARKTVARRYKNQKIWNDMYDNLKEVTGILPLLQMPVLLVWGDRDRVLDISSVQVYKRYLPTIRTSIIKNCGHTPMLECPNRTAKIYMEFLSKN